MHFSLRRRPTTRSARLGTTVALIALTTLTTLTTASQTHSHSAAVALDASGWRIGQRVATVPQTGVVRFSAAGTPATTLVAATAAPPPPPPKPAAPPAPTPPPPPPGPPSREVLGFAPSWTLGTWHEWRMQDLSAIAYFGVTVDGNGNTVADDTWSTWQGQQLTDMVNAAHANHVRVYVTLICFDNGAINGMVTDGNRMTTAVRTATDLMRMRGLDGVVLDFEGRSDPQYPYIQQGMTQFVSALHASVKAYRADAQLVVATYSGSASSNDGIFNIGALSPNVDAFFVMAYDMQADNSPGHASATAPLQGGLYSDSSAVSQYLAKTSADKVILGVPYYGYKWNVNSPDPNAATTGDPQSATYSQLLDDLSCAQQLTRHDGDATPWATWYSPGSGDPCGANLNSWREVYFDTATTIGAKYDLVNRANLLGTGMWALGFDSGHPDLWDALQNHVTARH